MSDTQTRGKHTRGPWDLYSAHPAEQWIDRVFDDDDAGERSYNVFKIVHSDNIEKAEAEANARLIAAAPEMAEELLHALRDVESRLYMLPIEGKGVSEQKDILSAQIGRYKSVLRKAGVL